MIKIGTKVYRNIQEQVAKNTKDIAEIMRRPVLQVVVVDELPEEGEGGILYLLPVEDPEEGNYYEEYLWIDGAWELIGSTAVDISNMCTTDTAQEITGEKTFAFSIKPATTSIYDLGSSSFKWSNIYLNSTIYIGSFSSTYINTDAYGGIAFNVNSNTKFLVREATTYINNNFYPLSDGTRDIGTNGAAFKDLYLNGNLYASEARVDYVGKSSTNLYAKGLLLAPDSNGTKDLGRDTLRWKDLYLSGNLTDGTNTATIADIAALITYAKAQGWIS